MNDNTRQVRSLQKQIKRDKFEFGKLGCERDKLNDTIQRNEADLKKLKQSMDVRWKDVPSGTRVEVASSIDKCSAWNLNYLGAYIPKFKRPFVCFNTDSLPEKADALSSYPYARLVCDDDIEKYTDKPDRDFEVGDEVYCGEFGIGYVTAVGDETHYNVCPVVVEFCSSNGEQKMSRTFRSSGYFTSSAETEANPDNEYRIRHTCDS